MSNPLYSYRKKKGLTQSEIARALGVSRQMVQMLETGDRGFSAEMAVKVEKMFGIDRVLIRPDIFRRREAA